MIKISKNITIQKDGKETQIKEININKENFTPKILLDAEREFLITGGIFPAGEMESSKAYLAIIASKIIGCKLEELTEKLTGVEFLEVTNEVKGLFDGSGLNQVLSKLLEKQA